MSANRRVLLGLSITAFAAAVLVGRQANTGGLTATTQTAAATISGVVLRAGSAEPLRKAEVTLLPAGGNQEGQGQGRRGQGNLPGQLAPFGENAQPVVPGQASAAPSQGQATPQQVQGGQNAAQGQRGRGAGPRSATTEDDGTFVFTDVAPGTYRIRVDRDGFLSQEYGQRSWTGTGVPVAVQAGQTLSSVTFQLVPGGTIAGRILDENLEPVVDIQVQALTYVYQNGSRTLVSQRQVQTDDLGEYRLYWLTPGDHYVSAIPNSRRGGLVQGANAQRGFRGAPAATQNEPEETYAATFYPGGTDPETAAPIRVAAASEVRGIDFVLRPIPTVRVSGRVTPADIPPTQEQVQQQAQQQGRRGRGGNDGGGRGGRGGGGIQVLLSRVGASLGDGGGRGGRGGGRGGRGGLGAIQFQSSVSQDGTFEIAGVIPGTYNLIAIQQGQGQIYSTMTRLDVGYGDMEGLNLAVRPGVEITGQIYPDGTPPSNFQMTRLRVSLSGVDFAPVGPNNAQVDENGKFTIANVPAMSYRVNLQGLPTGAYLITGRFGGIDALGDPVQVEQGSTLALQVGFNAGQVGVTVTDALSQPYSGAITALIPAVRNRSDLYKSSNSDGSGRVNFTGVAPGDYKVIAWEDIPQGAYLNSDFVAAYEDRAQSIHVDPNGAHSVQLKVVPREVQ